MNTREPRFRLARADDAEALAALHAESWRRHYRGAYSDAFLDGDVMADRLAVWRARLRTRKEGSCTILAEDDGLVGFAHTVLEEHPRWGALLDNMHVVAARKRQGIGTRLLALTAEAVIERRRGSGLYLWVLEQNTDARAFYEARGGRCAGRELASPPGGIAHRISGAPAKLRFAWRDPAVLLQTREGIAQRPRLTGDGCLS
jgi:GNAT superfamily N-acetyltransferase